MQERAVKIRNPGPTFFVKTGKNEKMSIDTFSNKTFCAIICSNENQISECMRKSDV